MMQIITLVHMMMQVTMLVQTMMQATGDGGVRNITSPFSDESHKEWPWVCPNIASENLSLF